jgi:putative addiction module component (TIGR02574 family)
MDLKTLEKEALRLSAEDRAALAQRLLLSLDDLPAAEHSELWLAEADRRARQLDRGEVEPIPAEEVRRKAQALLR